LKKGFSKIQVGDREEEGVCVIAGEEGEEVGRDRKAKGRK